MKLLQGLLAAETAYATAMQTLARNVQTDAVTLWRRTVGNRTSLASTPTPPMPSPSSSDDPVQGIVSSLAALPETLSQVSGRSESNPAALLQAH